MTRIEDVARRYWKAEESRDLAAILSFFSPDADWQGPSGLVLRGRDQIQTFYAQSVEIFPGLEVEVGRVWDGPEGEAAIEWAAVFTSLSGKRVDATGVSIMRLAEDCDQFVSLRACFDPALLESMET